ncbi:hypothetical protein DFJ73DRAFT_812822 [Zopfochytrium polystomum]|nr:hypothetical protein DFJ73DRAFT_812822 [Zopfochytrium polystomum]
MMVLDLLLLPTLLNVLMFSTLAYHTSYRAMVLIFPHKHNIRWAVAAAVSIIELGLNLYINLKQKLALTLVMFACAMDSLFFIATQYRIVLVMTQVNKAKVTLEHYVDAVVRCACYSGAVVLYFLTSSDRTSTAAAASALSGLSSPDATAKRTVSTKSNV